MEGRRGPVGGPVEGRRRLEKLAPACEMEGRPPLGSRLRSATIRSARARPASPRRPRESSAPAKESEGARRSQKDLSGGRGSQARLRRNRKESEGSRDQNGSERRGVLPREPSARAAAATAPMTCEITPRSRATSYLRMYALDTARVVMAWPWHGNGDKGMVQRGWCKGVVQRGR